MILSFTKCRFPTKRQTLLFQKKKKGGGGRIRWYSRKTPAGSMWPPQWSRLLWLGAHSIYLTVDNVELSIYFELLTLCMCSVGDEQTSVEINPGLIKLLPLFQ